MEYLRSENFKRTHNLLLKAETELRRSPQTKAFLKLQSITMNNLGCYYKRIGDPTLALSYLSSAQKADAQTDNTNAAGTNLNICAILSELG